VGNDGELLVSHLMYADDIVLLGDSPADLQQLLDALSGFCAALGLDVSLAKTQVMCFGLPVAAPPPTFTYAGRTLPHTDSYKYLGTTFTPADMAGDGLAQVRSNVGRAFNNVRFKFDRLGCTSNIHLQLHLYDAIVTPQPCHPVRYGASTQRHSSSGGGWRPYTAATFAAFAGCRTACLRRR